MNTDRPASAARSAPGRCPDENRAPRAAQRTGTRLATCRPPPRGDALALEVGRKQPLGRAGRAPHAHSQPSPRSSGGIALAVFAATAAPPTRHRQRRRPRRRPRRPRPRPRRRRRSPRSNRKLVLERRRYLAARHRARALSRSTLLHRPSTGEAIDLACTVYGSCSTLWRRAKCESARTTASPLNSNQRRPPASSSIPAVDLCLDALRRPLLNLLELRERARGRLDDRPRTRRRVGLPMSVFVVWVLLGVAVWLLAGYAVFRLVEALA